MLVTHNDIPQNKHLTYQIISPIAVEYNSSQYRPDEALEELKDKSNSIGGNAIIGFRWSPIPIISKNASNNMMAQGTAVFLTIRKAEHKQKSTRGDSRDEK